MQIDLAYRLKLHPTREQAVRMFRYAGAVRWLWNRMLKLNMERYESSGTFVFRHEMSAILPGLKQEYPWLVEVPVHTLQRVCRTLDLALKDSFTGKNRRKGFPRFKAKYGSRTAFYVSNDTLRIKAGKKVVLPKLGAVRFRAGRLPEGKLLSATVSFDGRAWWCIVQCRVERDVAAVEPAAASVVGADAGVKDLIVASDGLRVSASRPYRKAMKRLARAQRVFARRKKGSARRSKQAALVRRIHVRVADCRRDLLHKTSRALVDRASAVVLEDLSVAGMMRTELALSVADAGMGELRRQVTYKAQWAGKTLVVAGRFFPSTQACSVCGAVKSGAERLRLQDRTFRCACGNVMDRDLNAARNIRRFGLESLGLPCPDIITVGQALPEPAEIRIAPPPNARGEPSAGPDAFRAGQVRLKEAGTVGRGVSTSDDG